MSDSGVTAKPLKLLKDLHEYSFALAETDDSGMYDYIAASSKKLFDLKASWISTYESEPSELTIRASSFSSEELSKAQQFIGSRLKGSVIRVSEENYLHMLECPASEALSLKNAAFGFIPSSLCDTIQRSLGIGWIIGISLVNHGKLLGNILFVGHSGQTVPEKEELLIFRAITSTAISKKEAERKLIESEELHRSISENSFDLICLLDTAGKYLYCNSSYYDILGYSNDELMKMEPFSIVHPEDMELALNTFRQGVANLRSDSIVLRLMCKEGSFKRVEHRAKGILNEKGELETILINGQDVSQRKKFEEALIKAKEEAESASSAKSDFLANMSHELRTPLSGVIGFSDLLESTTTLNAEQKEYVKSLKNSAAILMNLISDTLDLRKIETGKLEMKPEKTNLKTLFEEIYSSLSPLARNKELETHLTMPEKMPEYVITDPLRFKQILLNLTGNAIKFTEKGRIDLKVQTLKKTGNCWTFRISVEDTGIGIEPEKQSRVTESFFQVDSSSTRKYGGSGLGLSITEKLLEMMGTRLEISSTRGKGSVFSFIIELPAACSQNIPSMEKCSCMKDSAWAGPKKALIVDDNELNLFLTSKILKLALPDIEVFHAEDGAGAIKCFKKITPDLILLDIQMPDMNGFDVAMNIRSDTASAQPKIIAVSADVMKCDEKMCLEMGIDGYISKPFTKADLANAITRVFIKPSDKQ